MNLIFEIIQQLRWQCQMFHIFMTKLAKNTFLGASLHSFSQLANLMAFFLPMKILVMIRADRVPRYFQDFITPGSLHIWIFIMSFFVVVLYALAIIASLISNRQATYGANKLVQMYRGEKALAKYEIKMLKAHYKLFARSYADILVFVVGEICIAYLNFIVAIAIPVIIFLEIGITHTILKSRQNWHFLKWLREGIKRSSDIYIRSLSAANFLVIITILGLEFYFKEEQSVMIGILTIFLGRRILSSLHGYVNKAIKLASKGEELDRLICNSLNIQSLEIHRTAELSEQKQSR